MFYNYLMAYSGCIKGIPVLIKEQICCLITLSQKISYTAYKTFRIHEIKGKKGTVNWEQD